jgi:HK97 family phage major capsid protein
MQRIDDLEKTLPKDDGGVKVLGDEDDRALEGRPFKSLGDFLISVASGTDQRLKPLRSDVTGLAGYYDVTKAVKSDYIGHFGPAIKAPLGLQEGIPSAGGFLVGQDRNAGLLSRMYDVGGLLRRADIVGISANSNGMTFNAEDETSRATGSRRGGIQAYWAAEAETKTKSKPKFRQMELKLKKIIALAYATDELLEDAAALESWIMQNLPEEMAVVAEIAMFSGTGVGQMLGILNSGSLVSVAKEVGQAAATVVAENISKMWSRRWIGGRNNYVWLYNQDVEPELDKLSFGVGTGGSLIYMPPGGFSQSPYGTIKGVPALPVEYCSTLGTEGDIILADLSEYQMIDKGGVKSDSSIHVQFLTDETVFRFVYRLDGQPKWAEALTPMNGSNTVSPFVALATRA